jgi:beta-galactosidase
MVRQNKCLNGEWDFMPVYGKKSCIELPLELNFEEHTIHVPSSWRYFKPKGQQDKKTFGLIEGVYEPYNTFHYPAEWSYAETGVYRTAFKDNWVEKNHRLFIRFNGIQQRARIIVNRTEVAVWDEAFLPLRTDITHALHRNGQDNELLVICTTFEETALDSGEEKLLGLQGSWFGLIGRGIWQSVWLESVPAIYIADALIDTSVREGTISASITIDGTDDMEYSVRISVCDTDDCVKILTSDKFIMNMDTKEVSIKADWEMAHLWSPEDPFLYTAKIDLLHNEQVIDTYTVRFGFREFWIDGTNFMLNGVPIHLRGDSWHFQGIIQQTKEYAVNWYSMCREHGINIVRLHAEPYPTYYLDAADEEGMLIVDESAIYGSAKTMAADDQRFISGCKKHMERLVKRDRNHPSVVIWSIENEMRWVDGRDEYKRHIPELIDIVHQFGGDRPTIAEGDNRLVPEGYMEIESYHYNIDGTIDQWSREHPLMYGEHGGFWYICPQNSSSYGGVSTYLDFSRCFAAQAVREKLYIEDCRRQDVSGFSVFNLANYSMHSMPNEDVMLTDLEEETIDFFPKVIPKHSLTINNGYLHDYPAYIPGEPLPILHDACLPSVIIPVQYNTNFFDDDYIIRQFDVYNDTAFRHQCRVEIAVVNDTCTLYEQTLEFEHLPAERRRIEISFLPIPVKNKGTLYLTASLYHEETAVYTLHKEYCVYTAQLLHTPISTGNKNVVYWGRDTDYKILQTLVPGCKRIEKLFTECLINVDLLIIGSYIREDPMNVQNILHDFIKQGGVAIQLEQGSFMPGTLSLSQQSFFSAHMDSTVHPVLENITDDDLIFWQPEVSEYGPGHIVKSAICKPNQGDFRILLECSVGEFGDGGDLWSPLIEYTYGHGTILFNQLEICSYYTSVPAACLLMRNMLTYCLSRSSRVTKAVGLYAEANDTAAEFMKKSGLIFSLVMQNDFHETYDILIIDPSIVHVEEQATVSSYVKDGSTILVLPMKSKNADKISGLLGITVKVHDIPAYQLAKTGNHLQTKDILTTDLFGYDKVTCSPRNVSNVLLASDAIEVEGGISLLNSVTNQPWRYYFIDDQSEEFSKIALADICLKQQECHCYAASTHHGKIEVIFSQVLLGSNEKYNRIYSRLLANLGAEIRDALLEYKKGDRDTALDYIMALPYQPYDDFERCKSFYTDPEYCLNNLGENVYGCMKKIEKDVTDGFLRIPDSKNQIFFLTCFTEYSGEADLVCKMDVDSNSPISLWINGVLRTAVTPGEGEVRRYQVEDVHFSSGINRIAFMVKVGDMDAAIRPIIRIPNGYYRDSLIYRLTLDRINKC